MFEVSINGKTHQVDVEPDTPLLWVLRDTLGMTGTKYGCGTAQCGYCQSGQMMAATTLLRETVKPSDSDIADAMTNLCRCGTYNAIAAAIRQAAV